MPQARFRLQLPPIRAICTFRSFAATRRKAGIRDAPRHMPKRFGGHSEHRRKQGTAEHLRLLRSPVSVERRRPRVDAATLPAPAARLTGRGSGRRTLSALWHEPARAAMRPCVEPSTSARGWAIAGKQPDSPPQALVCGPRSGIAAVRRGFRRQSDAPVGACRQACRVRTIAPGPAIPATPAILRGCALMVTIA